jgi:hypothetical protein
LSEPSSAMPVMPKSPRFDPRSKNRGNHSSRRGLVKVANPAQLQTIAGCSGLCPGTLQSIADSRGWTSASTSHFVPTIQIPIPAAEGQLDASESGSPIGTRLPAAREASSHRCCFGLMANGENPQIVRAMLRRTNLNMLAHYAHGFKSDKLEAQGADLDKLVKSGVKSGVGND